MKRSLFLPLTILTLLFLSSCGGPGGTDPIDPTDPTTTTDPTDPTTTTDPTFPFPIDPATTTDPTDPTTTTDPTSPTTVDMTGTWTGTTTSTAYGSEETTLTLTQSGTSISGTMTIDSVDENGNPVDFEADATGTITGSSATISATYPITYTEDGVPVGEGEVEYQLSGTVSGTTYSGTLTLAFDNGEQDSGSFTFAQGGSTIDPSDPTVTTDPTDPSGSINGTVTAGIDVSGTIVAACLESDECATPVFASPLPLDSTGAYSIAGLQATPYIVLAIKDVDNNGLTAGDYVGIYDAPVSPPASGINFTLQPYTGSESPIAKQLSEKLVNPGKIQQFKHAP